MVEEAQLKERSQKEPQDQISRASVYLAFAVIVIVCALGSLTQTVTNSMLLGIQASFGTAESVSQWLTTIYMLVIGITVPLVSYLSRKMSLRALTVVAILIFIAGSLIDAFASDFWILFAGRIPQAVACGITIPMIQLVAMTSFPKNQVGTAMGISGIAMGFAPNIGPLIGGALVDTLGWRSFFGMLTVALVIILIVALVGMKRGESPDGNAHLDIWSFIFSTLGFGGLLLGFTNAAVMPLTDLLAMGPIIVGAILIVVFVLRQLRVKNPLINMKIFSSGTYIASFIAQNLLFASFMGITLIVPLFVQNVCGMSALDAGIVFIPATIFAIIVNPLAGILSDKIGFRPVVVCCSILLTAGAAGFIFFDASTPLWLITLMQTIRGIGVSGLIGPFITWGMMKLPFDVMIDGSAFFVTVRQACASFGTALMMILIATASFIMAGPAGEIDPAFGYRAAFALSAVFALGVLIIGVWKVRKEL